jgi:hypothetical protein
MANVGGVGLFANNSETGQTIDQRVRATLALLMLNAGEALLKRGGSGNRQVIFSSVT